MNTNAIQEVRKYSGDLKTDDLATHSHLDVEIQYHMRLFRAQRNFYISGLALFLFLVLQRLVTLVLHQASLEASNEAALRQATSASSAAQRLLEGRDPGSGGDDLRALRQQLEEAEGERDAALKKAEMLQCQAEATSREYDQLMEEHARLQKQTAAGDKKDD
ncbi:B-cell receptor-associated protein 31-like [Pollicipes pollicipes]|uniref:B-cell receptor-associated protein 31-like n=1 Tax=Pollicipes pollicipes TaxID=41117 RepID=UPI001884D228|nr:B-cell receptor-associated protein 31-like [Pollicipes pollicipes]